MKMTKEQIATAKAILSEENLTSLGFKNIGLTADKYYGTGYQYKDFRNIQILSFMGIRTLEFKFYVCDYVTPRLLEEEGVTDTNKQYCIYDTVNRDEAVKIDIHSNEELISICDRWAKAIKKAGVKKGKMINNYYKNLEV